MNLKEIIEEVHSQLDYNPELQSYKDSVARTVSRHYVETSNAYPWLFLQTVSTFTVFGQTTATSPVAQTLSITNPGTGTREAVFSAFVNPQWVDGLLLLPDGNPYRIVRVDTGTKTVYFTGAEGSTRYFGPTNLAYSGWTITFDRHVLPVDCAEPLGFMDRTDQQMGRLLFIDRRREEELFLNANDGGQVFVLIEDDHVQDLPPQYAPTLTLAGAGSLAANTEYEYCYTLVQQGRESPPSIVVSITTTVASSVSITLENTTDLGLLTGILKNVYRRNKTLNGRWELVSANRAETATVFIDDGTSPVAGTAGHVVFSTQEPRQYVRAYYTSATGAKLELRYLRKPRRLIADSDTPEWPEQYHYLLVYRTLQDICMQHGMTNQATMYERRGNEVLNRMKGKWLARSDKNLIRQGFTFGGQTVFERWGNPRKIG